MQIVRLITTWFISEHRKSGDRKTSVQSNQKMVFKKIMPHSRVCRNIVCLFEACAIDNTNCMIRGKSAQPVQTNTFLNDCLLIILQFVSAAIFQRKRWRENIPYNKYQNQTAQRIKLDFIFPFIRTCVYAYTNQTLHTSRLS